MSILTIAIIVLLTCALPETLNAQPQNLVTVVVPESTLQEGKESKLVIQVEVKEGYHIQANTVDDESLIPTSLEVVAKENRMTLRKQFPESKAFRLEGTDTFLEVFDGKFEVHLFMTPHGRWKPGKYQLVGRMQYQACDSRTCFFPRVLEFTIPVEIRAKRD